MSREAQSLQAFIRRKMRWRREMARLPIEDKIACLVEIQKMVRGIKKDYPVWKISRERVPAQRVGSLSAPTGSRQPAGSPTDRGFLPAGRRGRNQG